MFYRIFLVCYCKDWAFVWVESHQPVTFPARHACNRYHNTSSVTNMLQTLTWPTLQQRWLKTKLIMFYKIVHHIVAVPTTILIPTDPRIRQFHPFTYRHLHAFKDPYKYSFFPNTIIHWNLLPQTIVLCPTVNTFREQLTPTVLSHLQSRIFECMKMSVCKWMKLSDSWVCWY
jgi:hypothetical protein